MFAPNSQIFTVALLKRNSGRNVRRDRANEYARKTFFWERPAVSRRVHTILNYTSIWIFSIYKIIRNSMRAYFKRIRVQTL